MKGCVVSVGQAGKAYMDAEEKALTINNKQHIIGIATSSTTTKARG